MLVPEVNWGLFNELPGAADENFEKLCRALVRRHYGSSGRFKQLANQPGVEFHLELTESCDLARRHAGLVGNANGTSWGMDKTWGPRAATISLRAWRRRVGMFQV